MSTNNGEGKAELLFYFVFWEVYLIVWSYREVMYTHRHRDVYIERDLHKTNITLNWIDWILLKFLLSFHDSEFVVWILCFEKYFEKLLNFLDCSDILLFWNFVGGNAEWDFILFKCLIKKGQTNVINLSPLRFAFRN